MFGASKAPCDKSALLRADAFSWPVNIAQYFL
jgi:hypothetical protein